MIRKIAVLALVAQIAAAQELPGPAAPGALNPRVTQENISQTICRRGWTRKVRPPASYTNALKRKQLAELGSETDPHDWEEDHRVPLECGGHPTDPANLWLQPWKGAQGAHKKDRLENALHHAVCRREITLAYCQSVFLGNWWDEYEKRFGH